MKPLDLTPFLVLFSNVSFHSYGNDVLISTRVYTWHFRTKRGNPLYTANLSVCLA